MNARVNTDKGALFLKILGLPGINPVTEHWMKNLFNSLDLGQTTSIVQNYQCWKLPGSRLDLEVEIEKAGKERADIIIAKSIGTVIALNGYKRNLFTAKMCVFIGTPIKGLTTSEQNMLQEQTTEEKPILFIQQTNDRAGSITELRKIIIDKTPVKVVEIPGNDHMYNDIHQLKDIIESWHQTIGS